jgi:hypothetical protein
MAEFVASFADFTFPVPKSLTKVATDFPAFDSPEGGL